LKCQYTLSPGGARPFLRRILSQANWITRNGRRLLYGSVGTLIPLGERARSCRASCKRREEHEEGRCLQCASVGTLLRTGGSQLYAGLRVGCGAGPDFRGLTTFKFAKSLSDPGRTSFARRRPAPLEVPARGPGGLGECSAGTLSGSSCGESCLLGCRYSRSLKCQHTLPPGGAHLFLRRILPKVSRIMQNGRCLQCGSVGTLLPLGERTCSCNESCRRRVGSRGRPAPAMCKCRYTVRTGGSQPYAGLRVGRGAGLHYRELITSKLA
jgi:hypothetical protein